MTYFEWKAQRSSVTFDSIEQPYEWTGRETAAELQQIEIDMASAGSGAPITRLIPFILVPLGRGRSFRAFMR